MKAKGFQMIKMKIFIIEINKVQMNLDKNFLKFKTFCYNKKL